MAFHKYNIVGAGRRGKRFGRVVRPLALVWFLLLGSLVLVSLAAFCLRLHFPGDLENRISFIQPRKVGGRDKAWTSVSREVQVGGNGRGGNSVAEGVVQQSSNSNVGKSKRRKQHFPCEVELAESVEFLTEPEDVRNFTQFSIEYVSSEEELLRTSSLKPRFGGHQTLKEREKSFHAASQTIHCGFVQGPPGLPNTGFDLDAKDREYMNTCRVAVSSCIFGNSDFLRRPTSRKVNHGLLKHFT